MAPRSKRAAQPAPATEQSLGQSQKPKSSASKGKAKATSPATAAPRAGENVESGTPDDDDAETAAADVEDTVWQCTTLTESSVSNHPPVYTQDAKYFFTVVSSTVKVYSVATGQVVSTLSASSNGPSSSTTPSTDSGHRRAITSIILHPSNPLQLVTASLDGSIKIWDFLDALLLDTIELNKPVTHMCADTSQPDSVFVASTPKSKKDAPNPRSVLFRVSLRHSANSEETSCIRICKTQGVVSMASSPSGKWLVVAGYNKIYVSSISPSTTGHFTKYSSPEPVTCLAFHPTDEYFAVGTERGQIFLWYCLTAGDNAQTKPEKRAQTTMLHWHSHAVSALAFSPNGAYLLSGGEEAVLVIWQLDANKKNFIPRLGAPIVSIAVTPPAEQNQGYLVVLQDATLITLDAATTRVRQEIPRIKVAPSHFRPRLSEPLPLAVHNASSSIILPSSHPSSIQFYDPFTFALRSELEVSPSNRVSRVEKEYLEPARVLLAVTCPSGHWLATVDARAKSEMHLKIWTWDGRGWFLNTRIDRPHGAGRVTAMEFNPAGTDLQSFQLVTIGEDRNVKTWKAKGIPGERGRQETFWVNRSTFGWRDHVPKAITWSPDGSLIAVSFPGAVVLFDPETNALLQVLSCPEVKDVKSFTFVGQTGQYLAVISSSDMALWDLVSGTVHWHFASQHHLQRIIAHPRSDTFVILQSPPRMQGSDWTTNVLVFGIASPRPLRTRTLPFWLRQCVFFSLGSGATGDFALVGITWKWSIVIIGDSVARAQDERARGIIDDGTGSGSGSRTLLQDIFGASAILMPGAERSTVRSDGRKAQKRDAVAELELPAYEQPPLARLFDGVMGRIVGKRPLDLPPIPDAMEVDELVVEGPTTLVSAPPLEPEPDSAELDALTQMFRQVFQQRE
ncbi:WD40 repeat-like protein [Auricularia subglabra TFB-10046 SS5]|nr:WD40 repeat-like protein [Auricularia subglabra TFB-10046 SS5]